MTAEVVCIRDDEDGKEGLIHSQSKNTPEEEYSRMKIKSTVESGYIYLWLGENSTASYIARAMTNRHAGVRIYTLIDHPAW